LNELPCAFEVHFIFFLVKGYFVWDPAPIFSTATSRIFLSISNNDSSAIIAWTEYSIKLEFGVLKSQRPYAQFLVQQKEKWLTVNSVKIAADIKGNNITKLERSFEIE
jgi:hypothetical protein